MPIPSSSAAPLTFVEGRRFFLVPGFSKCGTTTLCALLAQHPEIYIPEIKETNFFVDPDYQQKWHEYEHHFSAVTSERLVGEGTTMYSAYQHERQARDRILAIFPDVRLIFIARNPIRRIESSYREFHHSGVNFGMNAPFGLQRAMQELPALIEDSKFWTRICNYREVLGDERILVVMLEDLMADHVGVLSRCFDFLGVDPEYAKTMSLSRLNRGEEKLYDSALLRRMRTTPLVGPAIARLSPDQQNALFQRLGLRRQFRKALVWDAAAKDMLMRALRDDTRQFLTHYRKSADYWRELAY